MFTVISTSSSYFAQKRQMATHCVGTTYTKMKSQSPLSTRCRLMDSFTFVYQRTVKFMSFQHCTCLQMCLFYLAEAFDISLPSWPALGIFYEY